MSEWTKDEAQIKQSYFVAAIWDPKASVWLLTSNLIAPNKVGAAAPFFIPNFSLRAAGAQAVG